MEKVSLRIDFAHDIGVVVVIEPKSAVIWHRKADDRIAEILVPFDEFCEEHRELAVRLGLDGELNEVEFPLEQLLSPDEIIIPVDEFQDHLAFLRIERAIADGFFEDPETGERVELDSPSSPLRKMGLI